MDLNSLAKYLKFFLSHDFVKHSINGFWLGFLFCFCFCFFGDLVRAFCTKPNVGNLELDSLKLFCSWVTNNVQYFDFFLPQTVR